MTWLIVLVHNFALRCNLEIINVQIEIIMSTDVSCINIYLTFQTIYKLHDRI